MAEGRNKKITLKKKEKSEKKKQRWQRNTKQLGTYVVFIKNGSINLQVIIILSKP